MPRPLRHAARSGLFLIVCAGLAACSSLDGASQRVASIITPYQIDVVQGNFVSSEQVALLKPGMERRAVRDLLGTPLLQSVFHADRWDYVFTIVRPGTEPQRRTIVATFKGDQLEKLDAPELPTEQEFVASISRVRASGSPPRLELSPEQKKALPLPPTPAAETVVPMGALRSYPPLEPS